jgi:hypothetical protein
MGLIYELRRSVDSGTKFYKDSFKRSEFDGGRITDTQDGGLVSLLLFYIILHKEK